MNNTLNKTLQRQHYGLVGNHSAVKICTWTKKCLKDEGFCYKQKFYGIRSHLCCQMTPSVGFCQNNCVYCWRTVEYSIQNTFNPIDDPELIVDECIKSQIKLLSGFGGNDKTNPDKLKESWNPEHFAISLSGEPTMYPKLNELIKLLHSRGKTTFLVTNGMLPEVLEKLEMPTQLYLSLSVNNKNMFDSIHNPLHKDGWDRLNKSLEVMNNLKDKTRTTIRATLINDLNMTNPEKWVELIERANPKFVELKGYMFVGSSRQRMTKSNMPYHEDVVDFSKQIEQISDYKIIDEKKESRVVLMMKKDSKDRIMEF